MNYDVLIVSVSPDGKNVVVSLSDNTINVVFLHRIRVNSLFSIGSYLDLILMMSICFQVFYMDSLKFFIFLYGHKLLVFCMDTSSDGDLLVSGSTDKNVKIWVLVFGIFISHFLCRCLD